MNKLIILYLVLSILFFQKANAGNWKFNEKESFVIFIAKNLGMSVSGKISGMKVSGNYNSENVFASNFIGSIDIATIDTKISMRDNHLKSSDYFDIKKYPKITFKSQEIKESGSVLKVIGDVTIKGVTKEIEIPFVIQKNGNKHTFVGDVTIQRKDFELGSNTTLIMADVIKVRIFAVFEDVQ
ncbi:MAG: YceI family protein [Bacteroidota bacterium]|nr:YceI family protein [Bacteroidota bacterium]